jgi:predicted dehydrogenase/threonine dehydrogenase-like Zn-dependent dehydrogenase
MKQILHNLSNGTTELVEAPAPQGRDGHVLIDTTASLISIGTERMLVDFGRASLVSKARQQPEKVRQVINKARADGLMITIEAVRSKLGQPIPLGYCNVGIVREAKATGFAPGDRVASNGPHADVVCVPRNLCAKIPDSVSDEAASFTIVASIGLQGIRLAKPTLGECFVVTGVGLIGLLTVQMLRAQGCRVLAIDFDVDKLLLARSFGAETCNPAAGEDPVSAGIAFSRGHGVDCVIITASTQSNEPVQQAAAMCRKRGRIILVGVAGLALNRADFYEKELSFQVSCSYGPGRYDSSYEEAGNDYPLGYVRWTEQRNFEAVLDLMESGALDVSRLVTHRVPFNQAAKAYDVLTNDKSALGIMLDYEHPVETRHASVVALTERSGAAGVPVVGFAGAGNYASRVLIPAFKAAGASLHSIASSGGTSAVVHGRKSGFANATSDTQAMLENPDINVVAIATRHNSHANLTCAALDAGKHVFVEKPLALTMEELAKVEAAHARANTLLMVGFNRRFAPLTQVMKRALDGVHEPKSFVMLMNAGEILPAHWTQNPEEGGGRIIGEACHYIDLMRFLAGAPIVSVQARRMGGDSVAVKDDKAAITLGFEDGSFGTIHYLANGAASFPKERIEIFAAGRTLQLDNFLKLKAYNWPGVKGQSLWRQDKGAQACVDAFAKAIQEGGPSPIPAQELFEVSRVAIEVGTNLR